MPEFFIRLRIRVKGYSSVRKGDAVFFATFTTGSIQVNCSSTGNPLSATKSVDERPAFIIGNTSVGDSLRSGIVPSSTLIPLSIDAVSAENGINVEDGTIPDL